MRVISVILISVWLMLFGALNASWLTMSGHSFGVVTFIVGLVILIVEFLYWGGTRGWRVNV